MLQLKRMKFFLAIFAVLFSVSIYANTEVAEGHAEEEVDVTKTIFEHIGDNHDWHLWDLKDENGNKHAVSIPLPIILVNTNPFNIDVFLSSEFKHGHAPVTKGDVTYIMHEHKIYIANEAGALSFDEAGKVSNAKPLDFSITKNVTTLFFAGILMLIIFISTAKAYKKRPGQAPKGLQGFMEPLILYVTNEIARPNIGEAKYKKFLPYLITVFFFIWFLNMIGLIPIFPGSANVTGNIAVPLVLSVMTMLIVNISANKAYWGHIFNMPGLPKPLLIIMIPIELIGVVIKPFALMIRLFANITAGHIVVLSLISLIFIFKTLYIAPVSVAFVLFMDVLELFVAALQAYIFTMLSALFIGLAVQEHH